MSTAFVVGATGAVGSELVKLLADCSQFSKVAVLARRNVDAAVGDKFVQQTVDFDKLDEHTDVFKNAEIGFCALGTTRKKSGADGFYKVDHDYVLNTAKLAKENGVKQFVLISSAGASESSFFLYPKTKGQVEREVGELGFEKFIIIRPGLIEAERGESRIAEDIGKLLVKPFKFITNSLSSSATQIAEAMIMATRSEETGKAIWNNCKIIEESKKYESAT